MLAMAPETLDRSPGALFEGLVRKVTLALYVVMIAVVGLQIAARWVLEPLFGTPLPWTVNLSQLLLVYVTFFGAAVASAKREHISLDLLVTRLSDRTLRVLFAVRTVLAVAFVAVMIRGAYPLYQSNKGFSIGGLPEHPPFTQAWLYVPLIVGGAAIVLWGIRDLWEALVRPERVLADIKREDSDDE